MLERWLGDVHRAAFDQEYLGRKPLARCGTGSDIEAQFDWARLGSVLEARDADVVVVATGRALTDPPPNDLAGLRHYFREGIGVTVRGAEQQCRILSKLGEKFAAELGRARFHLFATPASTYGFGWHYNDEHVFIVQTQGVKDYYFRDNTVAAHLPAGGAAFRRYSAESSSLLTARLLPGDVLYLPARWWHMARCIEDSLSISVGVTLPPLAVN